MIMRPASLIALALATSSLASCGSPGPAEEPPLSEEALAAVTEDPGAPTRALARAADELFTLDGLGETRALVVYHGGALAVERYAPGYDKDTRFVSWSMAKTVTAVMIGMLVADGQLRLDAPAPVPRWERTGDPRAEITLRHLLQMRSGLEHSEASDPPYESGEVRMLFLDGRDDMADYATAQPLEAEPGAQFEYSSNTTVILADIAARALTDSTDPDVRRKADLYASGMGVRLKRVLTISERVSRPGPSQPAFRGLAMAKSDAREAAPVAAGEQTLSVSVSVSWELE